jgi:hypothetical protein
VISQRRVFLFWPRQGEWLVPTKDILDDRGMMGDGVIDIELVRSAAGYSEIEIFSSDGGTSRGCGFAGLHRTASAGGLG